MNHTPSRCGCVVASLLLAVLMAAFPATAEVRLPGVFSDHMVLQRDLPLTFWGWAAEGEMVTVEFQGQKVSVAAFRQLPSPLSRWQVKLGPFKASATPASLVVTGNNRVERKNVLVGDVWICTGQANMEFPLNKSSDAEQELPAAIHPLIRFCTVPRAKGSEPLGDVRVTWQECRSPGAFSAVG